MRTLGRELSRTLKKGDWVAIDGPLGAGKTVLCAAIINSLGYVGEVTSPSYAIVHNYDPPDLPVAVAHADLYRLDDVAELDELGLFDESAERITLVEWAERAGPGYAKPSHHVTISVEPDGSRRVDLKLGKDDIAG
ncbi:MAG: tRNA (adenosine(37)-N6)-threonylcarbamoyltransferase complex ATPase subunit type 1 TsaE [Sphingomonadaceae bacterium]|nr:tRNA (adenosine(37)-N6)-threonylcarbamoyltransferase complex ATPase subunit type 1 TsaE [Sphingomonadaceae bacterium]